MIIVETMLRLVSVVYRIRIDFSTQQQTHVIANQDMKTLEQLFAKFRVITHV